MSKSRRCRVAVKWQRRVGWLVGVQVASETVGICPSGQGGLAGSTSGPTNLGGTGGCASKQLASDSNLSGTTTYGCEGAGTGRPSVQDGLAGGAVEQTSSGSNETGDGIGTGATASGGVDGIAWQSSVQGGGASRRTNLGVTEKDLTVSSFVGGRTGGREGAVTVASCSVGGGAPYLASQGGAAGSASRLTMLGGVGLGLAASGGGVGGGPCPTSQGGAVSGASGLTTTYGG